ncbi:Lipolytic enzyme, G-D-S-L [Planktothrix tepida]|uniref:Lipolytic enzyme, G-D-S-L n=2 Tax=Planktothrix TaxID=54304 RepID=A0A1J1LM51_9CYAN|nr:SGNH/GDSL hydrolase family protein [Planktothrix tepida]CAD5923641.1 Lipolytic enzyme, G-D-S-L [Planktothrix pseudagardhii]CAD5980198.1 Lipolytic enzyme, G-D-S-L [Planktothrix tepida]CUR33600.1 Lipolytic enzyme, G-D-S-L [Planktothrix tepida PCC 9214]
MQRQSVSGATTSSLTDALGATQLQSTSDSALINAVGVPRHRWTYEQWVEQLKREANAIAERSPEHLRILAGDSLSLWFPSELLPPEQTWLNQGISGETSAGLLKRIKLFDITQPDTIFVMIGINDLIRGVDDTTLLNNYREIIRDLRWVHPDTQIVVQSILPHSGKQSSWEGRDRLLKISNERIRNLNQSLKLIAEEEGAYYFNLHSLFTDADGNLRPELSTDGLHLSQQGYLVWSSALKLYTQIALEPSSNP